MSDPVQPLQPRPEPPAQPPAAPPLAHLRLPVGLAAAFMVATVAWALVGDPLPGGRSTAVHLFTVGVLTNLVAAFTTHFTITLTRAAPSARARRGRTVLLNLGALMLVAGLALGDRWSLVAGAVVLAAAVTWLYASMRRMRRSAVGARFAHVVRAYERAAGAFGHGAVLGAVLGAVSMPGEWFAAVRLAHVHAMVLGWGGLVLLATLVFFGPTVLRTRIRDEGERLAAPALRWAPPLVTVATAALLLSALPDPWGVGLRVLGAVAVAGYAAAAAAVIVPVARAAPNRRGGPEGLMLVACGVWLVGALAAGAVAVGADAAPRVLDAVGAALLVGGLAQAILGSLVYFAPMLLGAGPRRRARLRARLLRGGWLRLVAVNLAGAALVVAALLGPGAQLRGELAVAGWALLAVVVAALLAAALAPIGDDGPDEAVGCPSRREGSDRR